MKRLTIAILAILTMALSACTIGDYVARPQTVGSGKLQTKQFDYADFSEIHVGNAFQVEIAQASTFSVAVTTDDNLFEHLRVVKQGNALQIFYTPTANVRPSSGAKATITLPTLTRLNLSGATNGTLAGFKSEQNFDATISGASKLRGDISSGNARVEATGASTVTLTGSAHNATFIASGASQLHLDNFAVASANVELSGSSNGTFNAKSKLDYNVSGASHLIYLGSPTIGKSQTSGGSSATRQ